LHHPRAIQSISLGLRRAPWCGGQSYQKVSSPRMFYQQDTQDKWHRVVKVCRRALARPLLLSPRFLTHSLSLSPSLAPSLSPPPPPLFLVQTHRQERTKCCKARRVGVGTGGGVARRGCRRIALCAVALSTMPDLSVQVSLCACLWACVQARFSV